MMNMLMLALAAVNPLTFPTYEQDVEVDFASAEVARMAACEIAPLPDDATIAFSCRWDDTTPAHAAKAEMMRRAGVKGTFYFNGSDKAEFFRNGPAKLIPLGHAIGNHTLSHPHMMKITPNAGFREIAANRVRLEVLLQHTVTSYVAPYGWRTDPLDDRRARVLAEAVVASGHFVSEDGAMPWSKLSPRVWMWTNRFAANDRQPARQLFVKGVTNAIAAAKSKRAVPRVTLGTHSWCDEKGNADQEAWLREFFHPEGAVQMNDWEYGAYRYQYLHGGVEKVGVVGSCATFRVKRYAAAYVGDAIPLSLRFSAKPVAARCAGAALQRQPRGTWALPQEATRSRMPVIARAAEGDFEVVPDEAAARLLLRLRNRTDKPLRDLYLAAPLPPKWSVRRVSANCAELAPGGVFEATLEMGTCAYPAYAEGEAYYPASADFVAGDQPRRIWAETSLAAGPKSN